jgi:hypothetical protein
VNPVLRKFEILQTVILTTTFFRSSPEKEILHTRVVVIWFFGYFFGTVFWNNRIQKLDTAGGCDFVT